MCSPSGIACFQDYATAGRDECITPCLGLYADITFGNETILDQTYIHGQEIDKLIKLQEEYNRYKSSFVENLYFDPTKIQFGKFCE